MPAPICVQCQLEMRCQQNDYLVNDLHTLNLGSTYWLGDLFKCLKCHAEIVVGFGREMDELKMFQLRKSGVACHDSIVFAHELSQLEKFPSQFRKKIEAVDA